MKDKTFYRIMNLLGIVLIFIVAILSYSLGLANGEVVRFEVDNQLLDAAVLFHGTALTYTDGFWFERDGERCDPFTTEFKNAYAKQIK